MKEAFLSGFCGCARLFVDLYRAPFLVMRNYIVHARPKPSRSFHGCHVEHRRGRAA